MSNFRPSSSHTRQKATSPPALRCLLRCPRRRRDAQRHARPCAKPAAVIRDWRFSVPPQEAGRRVLSAFCAAATIPSARAVIPGLDDALRAAAESLPIATSSKKSEAAGDAGATPAHPSPPVHTPRDTHRRMSCHRAQPRLSTNPVPSLPDPFFCTAFFRDSISSAERKCFAAYGAEIPFDTPVCCFPEDKLVERYRSNSDAVCRRARSAARAAVFDTCGCVYIMAI